MKRFYSINACFPALVTLIFLVGCTSGLSSPSSSSEADANSSTLTSGIISTDGGLSVSGEVIPSQSITVIIDGEPAHATDLEDGMRVTVESQDSIIQSISYHEDVKGPIDYVELDGSMNVLGQTIYIFSSTYFDESAASALKSGDVIEVSGLRDSNDILAASRIELKQRNTTSWSVRGPIRDLNRALQVFRIGNLTVDYTQTLFDDMSESTLVNGLQVEVKDENRTYEPGSLYLIATEVENHDSTSSYSPLTSTGSISTSDGAFLAGQTEVEIDGIVTGIDAAAGTLEVEGIEITTSSETEYQDDNNRYLNREAFFALLRQGVSVVKVKWRPFTGYDQPPRELELES